MVDLYLTPASISYLAQWVLSATSATYLALRLRRREHRNAQSLLLASAMLSVSGFLALFFLDVSLLPTPRLYVVIWENPVLALALTLLLQFSYHFPVLHPARRWEARLVLVASASYTVVELGYAALRLDSLVGPKVVMYRPPSLDGALIVLMAWLPVAFLVQALHGDRRQLSWLRRVASPQGEASKALRSFALVFLIFPLLAVVNLLRGTGVVTTEVYNLFTSLGSLLILLMFVVAYLNYLPETTSLMIKLAGITLTVLLALLGIVGWTTSTVFAASYRPPLPDSRTVRLLPGDQAGYVVADVPFHFEPDLGERQPVADTPDRRSHPVNFEFPFFGRTYSQVFVTTSGVLSLGEAFYHPSLQNGYGHFPGVFPLVVDLYPTEEGGVYARRAADRLVVTWFRLPARHHPERVFTFQAVLYADGRIDFTYNGLPDPPVLSPNESPSASPWFCGVSAGVGTPAVRTGPLAAGDLVGATGVVQDVHLAFRGHLGRLLTPLAGVVLGGSVIILVGLPLLFQRTLTRPLGVLLQGVRRMEQGDLGLELAVRHRDEIGFLTRAFNDMGKRLNDLVNDLDTQVRDRTRELSVANEGLLSQLREIEILKGQLQEQAIRDPLTGLFNRRYLDEILPGIFSAATRAGQNVGFVLFDADHFKSINDDLGHEVGDRVLRVLGKTLSACVRKEDRPFRMGGEEFLVILPGVTLEDARRRAEEIREAVAMATAPVVGRGYRVTLSAGVVAFPLHGTDYETLFRHMDAALYQAKQGGRDMVIVFAQPSQPSLSS